MNYWSRVARIDFFAGEQNAFLFNHPFGFVVIRSGKSLNCRIAARYFGGGILPVEQSDDQREAENDDAAQHHCRGDLRALLDDLVRGCAESETGAAS